MIGLLTRPISAARVPLMARESYRRELATSWTFPVALSMTEGGVAGYIAAQVFEASALQVAIITAAGMFTNLTSILWAHATRGRRKVASIAAMMLGTLACVAGMGLLPIGPAGAWGLVVLVVIAHILRTGMLTARSTIWRHNYPRLHRGRITSRLAMVVSIVLLAAPTAASLLLEAAATPGTFRAICLLSAAIGLIGVVSFGRIRLRGERALLRFEQLPGIEPTRHGDAVGIYEYDERVGRPSRPITGQRPVPQGMWAVLQRDPLFRRYMLWQFIAGVSNMMVEPVLVYMAAEETRALQGGFFIGMSLTHGLPVLLTVLTLPLWAAKLDRMHVVRFRVGQSWLWTVSQVIIWAGAVWHGPVWATIALLALGRIVLGAARGAGTLAWNLGHNDFASRELVTVYMGIHVTLTGVRGVFAPFLGMALYTGFGGVPGIGGHVFAISALLSFISVAGFWTLERKLKRLGPAAAPLMD